jgi:uncharacterized protein (TIGR01777 family)
LRIGITGSHGLIGSALNPVLQAAGHEVVRFVRGSPEPGCSDIVWDPESDLIEVSAMEGLDAVIHLAGENLASGRWTQKKMAQIRDSRIQGTSLLCRALAEVKAPPSVLLSASAVGFYGNRGDKVLTENSLVGSGFLAELCRDWEAATQPAVKRGLRVVQLRFAVVLSATGGALAKMIRPFRFGLGGPIGDGEQYWSWISLVDAIEAIRFALASESISGPLNLAAPEPVTNREFASMLGEVLGKRARLTTPAAVLRLAFGEMVDETLLSSARVLPAKLTAAGFEFQYPALRPALEHLLRCSG